MKHLLNWFGDSPQIGIDWTFPLASFWRQKVEWWLQWYVAVYDHQWGSVWLVDGTTIGRIILHSFLVTSPHQSSNSRHWDLLSRHKDLSPATQSPSSKTPTWCTSAYIIRPRYFTWTLGPVPSRGMKGSNSLCGYCQLAVHCFSLIIMTINIGNSFHWGEGSNVAMHVGEAATQVTCSEMQSAKLLHGSLPQSGFGQGHGANVNLQRIKKRSLRRAFQRLDRCGHTWYKGQLWTKNINTPTLVDNEPRPPN